MPEPEKGPLRRCLVTRESLPKAALVRFVVSPDGTVLPDVAGRLPGRGMWLSARADVIDTPRARAALARTARASGGGDRIRVPDDLAARTRAQLAARIADLIGLARRAGQAVAGHERVLEWSSARGVGLLVQACDGAAEGRARLARRATGSVTGSAAVECPLTAAALGRIFGRDHAVHVAIAPGRLAGLIGEECRRLAGLQPDAKSLRDGNPPTGDDPGGTGTGTE